MANRPSKVPTWATNGSRVEPSDGRKETGWLVEDKPPAQYLNWMQGLNGEWLEFFRENLVPESFFGSLVECTSVPDISAINGKVLQIQYLAEVNRWFALVRDTSADTAHITTSSDGDTWEEFASLIVGGMTHNNFCTRFATDGTTVAVGVQGSVWKATTPWEAADFAITAYSPGTTDRLTDLVYDDTNGLWIFGGFELATNEQYVSWTNDLLTEDGEDNISDGASAGGAFLAYVGSGITYVGTREENVSEKAEIYKSTDGTNWTFVDTGATFASADILAMVHCPAFGALLIATDTFKCFLKLSDNSLSGVAGSTSLAGFIEIATIRDWAITNNSGTGLNFIQAVDPTTPRYRVVSLPPAASEIERIGTSENRAVFSLGTSTLFRADF